MTTPPALCPVTRARPARCHAPRNPRRPTSARIGPAAMESSRGRRSEPLGDGQLDEVRQGRCAVSMLNWAALVLRGRITAADLAAVPLPRQQPEPVCAARRDRRPRVSPSAARRLPHNAGRSPSRPPGRARALPAPALAPAAPGRSGPMLVRPRDRGVHRHLPGDRPGRIRPRLQPGHDPRPRAVPLPVAEQPVHRLPRPVPLRHIPLRRPGPGPPPDPVDELASCPLPRAPWLLAAR